MAPTQLDTDILSEFLKQMSASVLANVTNYLQLFSALTFSAITRYEIMRGFKELQSASRIAGFEQFCSHCAILPITDEIFDRAADLWVLARRGGHPCNDADLFIAATALEHGLVLATGNTAHFSWIPGLTLVDWRTQATTPNP